MTPEADAGERSAGAPGDPAAWPHAGRWLALLLVLALATRLALGFFDPFGSRGFNSLMGAFGTAAFAKNLDEHGFVDGGFMPYRWRLELADGRVEHGWYAHHPAGYALVTALFVRLLGDQEWVTRLPWLAAALLSIVALYRLYAELWGPRLGLLATAVYAFLPYSIHYSLMTWVDNGAMQGVFAMLLLHYVRWVREPLPVHLQRGALWVVVGGLLDWTIGFLVLPIGFHALALCLRSGGWRRLRQTLVLPAALLLPLLVHAVHTALVVPWDQLVEDATGTFARTTRLGQSLPTYLGFQWNHLVGGLTLPVLVLVCLGLLELAVAALRRRPVRGSGIVLLLLAPGPIYVACYPFRGVTHDFLWHLGSGGFAALTALVLAAAWRLGRRLPGKVGPVLVGLGALVLLAGALQRSVEMRENTAPQVLVRARQSEWYRRTLGDPEAIVFTPLSLGMLLYYAEATQLTRVVTPQQLEETRRRLLYRLAPGRPVWYVYFPASAAASQPELMTYLRAQATPETHEDGVILFDLSRWARG